jgi:hypothetical protein
MPIVADDFTGGGCDIVCVDAGPYQEFITGAGPRHAAYGEVGGG